MSTPAVLVLPDLGASAGLTPTPTAVVDLAQACVAFVQRSLGVTLDYTPETLPLVDHWLSEAREATVVAEGADGRELTSLLVAHAAGAYLGEVVRRRYASWWRAEGTDPATHRVELRDVYLAFSPGQVARDALGLERDEDGHTLDLFAFDIDAADREDVIDRLAQLPPVPEAEYRAPSTRLEVLDIAVEAILARRLATGDPALPLEPADYAD